jgi:tRNA(fMet)-specific endonuclease VapC
VNYYLDTDICIFFLKNSFPALTEALKSLSPDHIKISAIVKAELFLGAEKTSEPKRVRAILENFLEPFEMVSFSNECVMIYSSIRHELEKKGQKIGPNDFLIAATVLANHGTLVTHNVDEYSRIPQLKIQDWTKAY